MLAPPKGALFSYSIPLISIVYISVLCVQNKFFLFSSCMTSYPESMTSSFLYNLHWSQTWRTLPVFSAYPSLLFWHRRSYLRLAYCRCFILHPIAGRASIGLGYDMITLYDVICRLPMTSFRKPRLQINLRKDRELIVFCATIPIYSKINGNARVRTLDLEHD